MSAKGWILLFLVGLSAATFAWYRIQHNRLVQAIVPASTRRKEPVDGELPASHAIVSAYLAEWSSNPPDALMLEDMSVLPYPKADIREALIQILDGPLSEDRRYELEAAFLALADYREIAGERSGQAGSQMVARWESERAELSAVLQQQGQRRRTTP